MSYMQGSYVTSRPTGYTNLAISAAFLASGAPQAAQRPTIGKGVKPTIRVNHNANATTLNDKSASAMLAELDAQKNGGQPSTNEYYA